MTIPQGFLLEMSSLMSGTVGALLGAFWAGMLQTRDLNRRAKGAGRAILEEMTANSVFFDSLLHSPEAHYSDYSCSAWSTHLPILSQSLKYKKLEKLAMAYRWAPTAIRDDKNRLSLARASNLFCDAAGFLCMDVLDGEEFSVYEQERLKAHEHIKTHL